MFPSSLKSKSLLTTTFSTKRFGSSSKLSKCSIDSSSAERKFASGMGSPGRSCADTIRRSRQNVAIATQVLSPRAIGSSLKCQRAVKHFGPADDDEEGFVTLRRKTAWKKLCYYGISLVASVLLVTAIIIVIGFLQSEKQGRILTRTASNRYYERKPSLYTFNITTPAPEPEDSIEPTESHAFLPTAYSSFLVSSSSKEQNSKEVASQDVPILHTATGVDGGEKVSDSDKNYFDTGDPDKVLPEWNGADVLPFLRGHMPRSHDHINEPELESKEHDSYDDHDHSYEIEVSQKEKETPFAPLLSLGSNTSNKGAVVSDEKESVNSFKKVDNNNKSEDWKLAIVEDEQSRVESFRSKEEAGHEDDAAVVIEEVKVANAHPLAINDEVFSIEVPIYTPNRTISSVERHGESDNKEADVSKIDPNVNGAEIELEKTEQRKNNESASATERSDTEVLNTEKNKFNVDENVDPVETGGGSKSATSNYSGEIKAGKRYGEDEKFHRAVLHTALFNVEGDHASTTPEIIDVDVNGGPVLLRNPAKVSFSAVAESGNRNSKSRQLENRMRGRNRKIKIIKNDKVINFKATFNPPGKSRDSLGGNETSNVSDELTGNKNQSSSELFNYVNLRDFVSEAKHRRPLASSSRHSLKLLKSAPVSMDNSGETPRLLNSGPSLETILKSILSSVPHGQSEKTFHPYNKMLGLGNGPHPFSSYNQYGPGPNSDYGSNFATSLNNLISPVVSTPPSGNAGAHDELNSSQFRKRTFYSDSEHELLDYPQTSANPLQTENYFTHLLGQNPAIGSIGSPSAAGATLNNFYTPLIPAALSPAAYDFTSSGTSDSPQLTTPGVIPFDISSSYIPVQPQSFGYSNLQESRPEQQQHRFSFNNFYYPGGPLPSYGFTSPSESSKIGASATPGINSIGTLTTASGQPPTYNTIAQGMHLLNMISGVVPPSYFHDQVYNPSQLSVTNGQDALGLGGLLNNQHQSPTTFPVVNSVPTLGSLPELQPVSFQPQTIPVPIDLTSIYSKQKTDAPNLEASPIEFSEAPKSPDDRTVFHFEDDHADGSPPSVGSDDDQFPAASASTQHVLELAVEPRNKSMKRTIQNGNVDITELLRRRITSAASQNANSEWHKKPLSSPSKGIIEPRSFSFEILPQRQPTSTPQEWPSSSNILDDTLRSLNPDIIHTSLDSYVTQSKSKKKASVSLDVPKVQMYKSLTPTSTEIFQNHESIGDPSNLKLPKVLPNESPKKFTVDNEILVRTLAKGHPKNVKLSASTKYKETPKQKYDYGLKSGFFVPL